jgi:predicted transcriptional regulator
MSDKQFLVTGFKLIDNDTYRKVMTSNKGIEMTYQWLKRHIVRAPMRNVYCREVFDKYYMKGVLATTANEKELANKLFISNRTVRRNIEILESNGFIKVEDLKTKVRGPGQRPQKVYKLGRWLSEINHEGDEKIVEFMSVFDILTEAEFEARLNSKLEGADV